MGYIQNIRKKIGHDRLIAVGAGVFVYKDRKVLLQKRKDNLCWALHGGIVEMSERVEDAAKRELFEETGLIANKLELLGIFSGDDRMYTYPNGDEVYIIGIIYVCNDFSGKLVSETDETLELKWFDIEHLPQKISPPNIKPLEAFVDFIKRTY
ncbi:NUDIX hydrolase [Paenibacillus allorhizosphaerae]|uniref:Nucleoside triphosphatase NudI n=1 Tax=Paenibacillus allorhizosphaerae TaxID=2849866 RepID=A0ABM8VBW7_9BACL|nr:NUDIX hydrolase [Paenibacillus allorhizosphaerae]CAG7621916.1 Nucleoside triphosphatase NudI [Paenibacillus allorhizosphaerae]